MRRPLHGPVALVHETDPSCSKQESKPISDCSNVQRQFEDVTNRKEYRLEPNALPSVLGGASAIAVYDMYRGGEARYH